MNDDTNNLGDRDDAAMDAAFDEQFGKRLREHLRGELEPHVGRSTMKLDAMLAAQRPSSMRIGLRWSAAAMLLVGVGVAIPMISSQYRTRPVTAPPVAIQGSSSPPANAVVTSWSETYDAGTVFVDPETPARMLKRVRYEKAEWKDAAGRYQSAVTTPDEDVILVDLQKQ